MSAVDTVALSPVATESDALLPNSSPSPSARRIWQHATPAHKTWLAIGAMGAMASGCANGLTFVLYGRVLDAMARATVEGVPEILTGYVQLTGVELLGAWLQFFACSHVARQHTTKQDQDNDETKDDNTSEDGYIEALGDVCYAAARGCTAIAIALRFGWDSLLAIIATVGCTMLVPWLLMKWITRKRTTTTTTGCSRTTTNDSQPPEMVDAHSKLLAREVDELWRHARALQLMDATQIAVKRVQRLLQSKQQRSVTGSMVAMFLAMVLPAVIALVYTSWKVQVQQPTNSSTVAGYLAVAFLASWTGVSSLHQAWNTYTQGDVSIQKLKNDLSATMKSTASTTVASMSDPDKARAMQWLRSIAQCSVLDTGIFWVALAVKTVIYIASALLLGSSFAWLLQTSAPNHSTSVWPYALAIMVLALVLGLAFEGGVGAQGSVSRKTRDAVFLRAFAARLAMRTTEKDAPTPTTISITGTTLVSDSSHIAMYAMTLVEPTNYVSVTALCGLSVAVAVYLDVWFTLATMVALAVEHVPYAVMLMRDKALYRRFGGHQSRSDSILVALSESLLRGGMHVMPRGATIAMLYVQTQWIATGQTTLMAVLSIQCLGQLCFCIAHTSRFGMGMFLQDEAVAAASRMQPWIELDPPSSLSDDTKLIGDRAATPLTGDLVLETMAIDGSAAQRVIVKSGGMGIVAVQDTLQLRSIAQSLLRLTESTAVSATVGSVDLESLPVTVVRDRILVVDNDPVRLPGTLWENVCMAALADPPAYDIEDAARRAELTGEELQEELSLDKWLASSDTGPSSLQHRVLVARVLLQKPDILVVEDFVSSPLDPMEPPSLLEAVTTIRRELPRCKVLVVTTEKNTWMPR